jgi:hypothetical protein
VLLVLSKRIGLKNNIEIGLLSRLMTVSSGGFQY